MKPTVKSETVKMPGGFKAYGIKIKFNIHEIIKRIRRKKKWQQA